MYLYIIKIDFDLIMIISKISLFFGKTLKDKFAFMLIVLVILACPILVSFFHISVFGKWNINLKENFKYTVIKNHICITKNADIFSRWIILN